MVPLTDVKLRAMNSKPTAFKVSDAEGLFLLVAPSGSKLWRLAYRFGGKQKLSALGSVDSYFIHRAMAAMVTTAL
jgi:Arm DNA-binding domain